MTEPTSLRADIVVAHHVTREQERPLTDALAALGVTAGVRELPVRRATEQLTWLVLIALPLQAFLGMLGQKAAEGAYGRFREAVRGLRHRTGGSAGVSPRPVVLQDPSTGLRIVLEHDLPEAAYQQLVTLDLTRYRHGPLHYDRTLTRWRSELDEADQHGAG
ncbi:hypothetical protein I2W78_14405 [Streptomyces spinoverrucosus]|uniref:hypothetical protein n=1 Tax=Streptomyces spinoverrucosus TaxID=284043 RepID=UPI0018C4495C|nr:hypothetical protein [Streptomyces spinoverrucosus]MBG0853007.1 hypothetical protein [Streptomyces spinoverrucosus]